MKFICFFSIFFCLSVVSVILTQSTNSIPKSSKAKFAGKDRYFSKSYGEVQFNKYRGQLPPKGTLIECAVDCLSLATCHCIGLNIQTSECHFYGQEESPSYDAWKSTSSNLGANSLAVSNTNWTNRDYIFFTRDIFLDDSLDKVDLSAGRKILTSWTLDQNPIDSKKSKGKAKELPKKKPKKGKTTEEKAFPFPWIQIELKEYVYITEILLQTTREKSSELKQFQIRVGNESIAKFYETPEGGKEEDEESELNWSKTKSFDRNNLCFEQQTGLNTAAFFSSGYIRSQGLWHKTVKCQPCGFAGRFISIQSMEPCTKCKPVLSNQTAPTDPKSTKAPAKTIPGPQPLPIPLVSLQVYGYVIGGKARE